MKDYLGDSLFNFPMYRLLLFYQGVEELVDDKKVIVDKNQCMLRFKDLDCLLYNAEIHIGRLIIDTPENLRTKNYELKVFSPENVLIYHECIERNEEKSYIKVLIYENDKLKLLINRVLLKEAPYKSIRGRTWEQVKIFS